MEIEGFTYPEEAETSFTKKYGIEIEEDQVEYSEERKKAQSEREILYKIHEVANTFSKKIFGKPKKENHYLSISRNVNCMMTSKKFQLGYSPEKKNAFTEYALAKGYEKKF